MIGLADRGRCISGYVEFGDPLLDGDGLHLDQAEVSKGGRGVGAPAGRGRPGEYVAGGFGVEDAGGGARIMRRDSGSKQSCIWLIGDSSPLRWRDLLDVPLDPRHPARHNIWTPILEEVQERVYSVGRRRVDTVNTYVRNAVENSEDKPASHAMQWEMKCVEEVTEFTKLLQTYTPNLVLTFGSFAFEFARRSLNQEPEQHYRYWSTKRLGLEFKQRCEDFILGEINIIPLLHASIARGKFLESHKYFTGRDDGNYFSEVAGGIASIFLKHKCKLPIWVK